MNARHWSDWNALGDDDFRRVVRAEFEANYPAHLRFPSRRLRWHENKSWFLHMAEIGWIAPGWPRAAGGMGLGPSKLLIFLEEQERWGIARYQDHGVLMIGPLLMRYGTEAQRTRFLGPILRCEHIWCQGYSEPNSGSDLASVSTKARLEGDEFVIDGQKIWTTLAQDATHIFVLARTDGAAKPQRGLSFILVDMASAGLRVRSIRDIAGHEEFCEVFFDGVRVPAENLVGALNDGWTVAKSLLGFERISLGSPKLPEYALQILFEVARSQGVERDPVFADKLAQVKLDIAHLALMYRKFAAIAASGGVIGQDVSLLKIVATELCQRIADLIVETAGPMGGLKGDVDMGGTPINLLAPFYKARPATIYGGSSEIQRNILARQVLNLPQ